MESRFGRDFSQVRVHTDARAAQSARSVDALAYTVGRNVVFGDGQYAPHSIAGQRLLAHELTHVVQQSSNPARSPGTLRIESETSAAEVEANRAATSVLTDGSVPSRPAAQSAGLNRSVGGALVGGAIGGLVGGLLGSLAGPAGAVAGALGGAALGAWIGSAASGSKSGNKDLANELQALIDVATWKEIRKRVYPKESAAGIRRAKDRKAGKLPELSGLGRIKTLEHLAGAVRGLQRKWPALSADDRVKELGAAANVELTGADVPGFLTVRKKPIEFKGFFTPSQWSFTISEALVTGGVLNNDDAAEVANVTLHEGRHAEQQFVAARFSAGVNKKDAAGISAEQGIPRVIADQAVAKKFDAKTDPAAAALGRQMYQANVTDGANNCHQRRGWDCRSGGQENGSRDRAEEPQGCRHRADCCLATAKRDALRARSSLSRRNAPCIAISPTRPTRTTSATRPNGSGMAVIASAEANHARCD